MSINQRLDLKQSQSLTMTPQLQQAIKLLQLSNQELSDFVETELEKNPLLEREDLSTPTEERSEDRQPDIAATENRPEATSETTHNMDENFNGAYTNSSNADQQQMSSVEGGYDAFATNSFSDVGKGGNSKFDNPEFSFENTLAEEKTLREHLIAQIQLEFSEDKDRAIALLMPDYLDESGYMRIPLEEISERIGCETVRVEEILTTLQKLDPPGIFARDLKECLALQLQEQNRLDPVIQALLDNLDLLAKQDFKKLQKVCGIDSEDLRDMILEIRSLDPKPALAFDHFVSQTVIPDVLMRPLPKSKGGGWAIELNTETLPRVLVNKSYYTEINKTATAKKDKEYLSEQMATASWLVKAMDQRAQTIMKTATEIILQQEAFFNYGVEYLKPLVLRDVAEAIGMHESTISRVTTNKYIGTPRGVFEMKYFFSSGISSIDGGAHSSQAIKSRIKAMTEAEDPSHILSDDEIVTILARDGIVIARRTVAKYRDALKIPSSVQRRRQKKL